jgi:hypothetical protein
MSSPLWVTINGSRYQIERSKEPRKLELGCMLAIEEEKFVHSGREWQTVRGITVEEAMRIRDLNRIVLYQRVGTGECVTIDDDGLSLIWCKETNLLYAKMGEDETPPKNSLTGEISEVYSVKLHAMCVGKMVRDGDKWVPEDKASWMCSNADNLSDEE